LQLPTHYLETPLRMVRRDDLWEFMGGQFAG
jgi:hypothetical protein